MIGTRAQLVGRRHELDQIASALDDAATGDPRLLLVVGEAGIGKTEVLRAAAASGRDRGLRVLMGSAIESGRAIPFLPLMAPLRGATANHPSNRPDAAGLAAVDTVRRMLQDEAAGAGTGAAAQDEAVASAARLIDAIFDVLVAVPTLLVVDDVQWADQSTVTVLDYIGRRVADEHLAVVLAARDDDVVALERLPIADGRRYRQLALGGLSRAEVGVQIGTLLKHEPPRELIDQVFERSGGNPLFVEELVAAGGAPGTAAGSAALRSLILGRLAGLTDAARRSVEALAVLDRPAGEALVAAVAGLPPEATGDALDAAVRGGLAAARGDAVALRHPVIGEVVIASLGSAARRRLHARAASALEAPSVHRRDLGGVAERARHWSEAGDLGRAWRTSLEAADEAEGAYAFTEAHAHLERAIELWPDGEPGLPRARLRTADIAWKAGDAARALELARLAEPAIVALDPPSSELRLELFVSEGRYAWDAGERGAATRAFAMAAGELHAETPPVLRALALWGLGRGKIGEGRFDEAYDLATAAAAAAAKAHSGGHEGEAWLLAGMARAWDNRDGIGELERGLAVARAAGHPDCTAHGFQFLVDMHELAGRIDVAIDLARDGIATVERQGLGRTHGSDLRGRGAWLLVERGDWAAADDMLEPAEARAIPSLVRAVLAMRRGRYDEADSQLAASAVGGSIGGPGSLGGWGELARAELAWLRGDDAAASALLDAVRVPAGVWGVEVAGWRHVWRLRVAASADQGFVPSHPDPAVARALRTEAAAFGAGPSEAPDAWLATAAAWIAGERPYEAAWADLRQAEAAFAARDRDRARASLHAATEAGDSLGAVPLVERCEDLARRARVAARPVRRHRPDPTELTARELEVLTLVADGHTNRRIAAELFLSPKTVGIHVSRILAKLAAATRGEAVATARRRGLIG